MFDLVIVWETGEKEVYTYATREDAEKGKANFEKAFGSQVWACVRPKY